MLSGKGGFSPIKCEIADFVLKTFKVIDRIGPRKNSRQKQA
jgi:hypothetical protein